MRPSVLRLLPAVVMLLSGLALAACGGAATPAPTYPPGAIVVSADARQFDTSELTVPAGTTFPLVFVNKEAETHNLAIRTKPGFEGDIIFRFDPVSASTVVLEAGPIPAGTYFFLCELHPTMTGTVIAR